jgi:hypothetical protein
MHLLIPFASTQSDAAAQVLRGLPLPNLARLLGHLSAPVRDDAPVQTLSPPHERAIAARAGWHGADGCLPFAARAAAEDGIAVGTLPWGCVTPVHWQVGRDHVVMADPQALRLSAEESRAAFDAVRDLFESEGLRMVWGAPLRWYAAHDSLQGLACASLDRAVGRSVEHWMRTDANPQPQARLLRRLQSEVQLLLYPHPLNAQRELRGELPLNSFWLSGCGCFQSDTGPALTVADGLRAPLLAQDWDAWAQAWRTLDAHEVAQCLQVARGGAQVSLTLCGERGAHRFDRAAPSAWRRLTRRWREPAPHAVLEAL